MKKILLSIIFLTFVSQAQKCSWM